MAKKFEELRKKMSPERRTKIDAMAQKLSAEMPMHELRNALDLSQEQLAAMLDVKQGAVSKMEHQANLHISTLRRYIEALGGELEVQARFSDIAVKINLDDIERRATG